MSEASNHLLFLEEIGKLKHIKRTGWVLRGVNEPETVSGHMYRMSILSFLIDDKSDLNKHRCMELSLLHDMAECIVGDITPYCGVSKEEKYRREDEAMNKLKSLCRTQGDRMYELFKEYEDRETPESKFVKELDTLDMLIQAFEYEKSQNIDMQEFFEKDTEFTFPLTTSIFEELIKQRGERNNQLKLSEGSKK